MIKCKLKGRAGRARGRGSADARRSDRPRRASARQPEASSGSRRRRTVKAKSATTPRAEDECQVELAHSASGSERHEKAPSLVDVTSGHHEDAPAKARHRQRAPVQPPPPESLRTRMAGLQGYGVVALAVVLSVAALRAGEGFFIPVVFVVVISISLARIGRARRTADAAMDRCRPLSSSALGGLGRLTYVLSDEPRARSPALPDGDAHAAPGRSRVAEPERRARSASCRARPSRAAAHRERIDRPAVDAQGRHAVQVVAAAGRLQQRRLARIAGRDGARSRNLTLVVFSSISCWPRAICSSASSCASAATTVAAESHGASYRSNRRERGEGDART